MPRVSNPIDEDATASFNCQASARRRCRGRCRTGCGASALSHEMLAAHRADRTPRLRSDRSQKGRHRFTSGAPLRPAQRLQQVHPRDTAIHPGQHLVVLNAAPGNQARVPLGSSHGHRHIQSEGMLSCHRGALRCVPPLRSGVRRAALASRGDRILSSSPGLPPNHLSRFVLVLAGGSTAAEATT
jgi:hypothetical protein